MWIGHREEIRKLTFRVLAPSSEERLMVETSSFKSLYGGQFTKLTQMIKLNYLMDL